MKKFLCLILVLATLLCFASCNGYDSPRYDETIAMPQNGIFAAPDTFYHEWDIPSVRDVSVSQEGYYSMPVYRFDSYAELLHLKDIVGMDLIGNEVSNDSYCYTCGTYKTCAHDQYNESFFQNYSLLIGWCQYSGLILPEYVEGGDYDGYKKIANYTISRDCDLVVYLNAENSDATLENAPQWILVAVPKNKIKTCNSITFLVKLPTEEAPEEIPEETPEETPTETPEGTPTETPEGTPTETPEGTPEQD